MRFVWLKRYMPRSLYGRAALILILPVVTLQLVVSVVFIQRHFDRVTRQMAQSLSAEVMLLVADLDRGGDMTAAKAVARDLGIDLVTGNAALRGNLRRWYDFSGVVAIRELEAHVPSLTAVHLPNDHFVILGLKTAQGPVQVQFHRWRISASNPHQLLVHMLVVGVVMTLIAFIYLRNQLRPITRLARAAEAFGRGHHLPYTPAGALEVRAAGNAFLDMRNRIERQIEQRTLMLSGVSHDLRTPLTRLKLGLSLLEDEDREPMERDVEDMRRLLDEFLSFARGASEGEAEKTAPIDLVRQIVEDSARSGQNVRLGTMEGAGAMMLRPLAIRRAVENLINNAVRYGDMAEVSVRMSEKSLRIRVEDNGPGIAPDLREEAMKPFARLEPARNQNRGSGVGLGLSIATDIARAHGGVLRLGESAELGGLRADIVVAR